MRIQLSAFISSFIYCLILGCTHTSSDIAMANNDYELPQNCDFDEPENNSTTDNSCTPKLLDPLFSPFRGILVNAPQTTQWPANADPADMQVSPSGNSAGPFKLMVAGYFILDISTGENSLDLAERVILVAVNQKTAQTYSGKMENIGFRELPFEGGPSMDQVGEETVSAAFNIDLVQNLNIPIEPATYTIYAVFDDHKSNVLQTEITIE